VLLSLSIFRYTSITQKCIFHRAAEYKKYKAKKNLAEAEEEESFKTIEKDASTDLDEDAKNAQRVELEQFKPESRERSKQSDTTFNLQTLARFTQGKARRCVPASAISAQKP
jgi:hypothetical protein